MSRSGSEKGPDPFEFLCGLTTMSIRVTDEKTSKPQKATLSGTVMLIIVGIANPILGIYYLFRRLTGGYSCPQCGKHMSVTAYYECNRYKYSLREHIAFDQCWFEDPENPVYRLTQLLEDLNRNSKYKGKAHRKSAQRSTSKR